MEKKEYFFILGASDPEMVAIEDVLKMYDMPYGYAMYGERRARQSEEYIADRYSCPVHGTSCRAKVFVECQINKNHRPIKPKIFIGHHRLGDPGFGWAPEHAWEASSLGQVFALLGADPDKMTVIVEGRQWDPRVIAAADHCLSAACHGDVPGVTPHNVCEFRDWIMSHQMYINTHAYVSMVAGTMGIIQECDYYPGTKIRDMRNWCRDHGYPKDIEEAVKRMGEPVLLDNLVEGYGWVTILIGASEEQIQWFRDYFVPHNKLFFVHSNVRNGTASAVSKP